MAVHAPNASHHHTALGIKGADLEKEMLARPCVAIRQSGFEDGNEISTETDEGHTGVSNLDMGSYRTKAESSPNWEDGLRYSQGFEDYFYLLLGHDTVASYNNGTSDVEGVYTHTMEMPPEVDEELPLATIYHGFSKTSTDGRVFNNAMENELEVTFNADDKPSIKPTFVSDYNIVNTINPSRNFLDDHLSRTVMAQHTQVYIGDIGATEIWDGTGSKDGYMVPIDCFSEASFSVNNNAESQACHDDKFGENTKLMGAREVTGSITMPWHDATKYFETEYEAYEKYGHIVSELITQKQVWYRCHGGNIIRTSESNTIGTGEKIIKTVVEHEGEPEETTTYYISTGIPYEAIFKFPVTEVTSVTSTKSGNEAKDLTFEWKDIEQPTQSYMSAYFVTDLSACHIDTTGQARQAVYPPLVDGEGNPINQEFAPYKDQ